QVFPGKLLIQAERLLFRRRERLLSPFTAGPGGLFFPARSGRLSFLSFLLPAAFLPEHGSVMPLSFQTMGPEAEGIRKLRPPGSAAGRRPFRPSGREALVSFHLFYRKFRMTA